MSVNADDEQGPAVRASDAERQAVVERLNRATAEGRLTLAEFSDRSATAYAAATRGELVPLTTDLPVDVPANLPVGLPVGVPVDAARAGSAVSPADAAPLQRVPVGAIKRSGRWHLDRVTRMKVTIGPVKLDLSGAEVSGSEVDLYVRSVLGSVKVWIPAGARVTVDGSTTMGTRTIEEDTAVGPGPLVRLHIDTTIGTVKVYRV